MRYEEYFNSIPEMENKRFRLTAFSRNKMEEYFDSIHILEKNGYEKEGVLRYYPFGREFHNVVMMSIINEGEYL